MRSCNIIKVIPEDKDKDKGAGLMDYMKEIWSVISFIEKRIKSDIDYQELERITGFSYRHLREVFRQTTGISLSKYINSRKTANAAVMLAHTEMSATEIAYAFGFESYDTFTRVFKRNTGLTPSEFRTKRCPVGRRLLGIGMYAPAISASADIRTPVPLWTEENNMNENGGEKAGSVLYGVQKVHYGLEGWQCSPFPMCLKAVLNYMGQEVEYPYLMAASGMAFRLRWNQHEWDPGNVGIQSIYADPDEGYRRALRAVGRDGFILRRQGSSAEEKDVFKTLIRQQLDQGSPLISVGIAGPPEAGIVTGYREDGDVVLGWSLFQENMEFAGGLSFDESGYYITDNWWEHVECLIAVGEPLNECMGIKEIVENGVRVLRTESIGAMHGMRHYYGGQAAFKAWAEAVEDHQNFPAELVFPLLMERLMCQGDAEVMVSEGRHCAAGFLRWLGGHSPEAAEACNRAAGYFDDTCRQINNMMELRNGYEQTEDTLRKFADSGIRRRLAELIRKAAVCEAKAGDALNEVMEKMIQ